MGIQILYLYVKGQMAFYITYEVAESPNHNGLVEKLHCRHIKVQALCTIASMGNPGEPEA
jgi:hypothetical protein